MIPKKGVKGVGMRKAVMVSGSYPCVRAGKITEALLEKGWEHTVIGRMLPPQFQSCYKRIITRRCGTREEVAEATMAQEGELIHVHNEPNWPVYYLRDDPRPIIFNVHDVTSARPFHPEDPNYLLEHESYERADAFVFVSEEQRAFAITKGLDIEGKPYACIGNYASANTIIEKPVLPHVGGVVYAGGIEGREAKSAWRDFSKIADLLDKQFHYYPGGGGVDYGTGVRHDTILEYGLLTHRLSQHDWGFTGTVIPNPAWGHSLPNKVFEYMAAGIPFAALNNPLLKDLCDSGLGIYLDDYRQLATLPNPKPYAKRVKQERHRFTMRYHIDPVVELYEKVLA